MSRLEIIHHFLVTRILNHDPNKRPEATAILDMKYLSQAVNEYKIKTMKPEAMAGAAFIQAQLLRCRGASI